MVLGMTPFGGRCGSNARAYAYIVAASCVLSVFREAVTQTRNVSSRSKEAWRSRIIRRRNPRKLPQQKVSLRIWLIPCNKSGGEGGIRTPDTLLGCNCLAGSPVRPLQHLSAEIGLNNSRLPNKYNIPEVTRPGEAASAHRGDAGLPRRALRPNPDERDEAHRMRAVDCVE